MVIDLYQKILAMRLTASILYDRGKAEGLSPDELGKRLKPVAEGLKTLVQEAVKTDLPGVIMAIRALENEAGAMLRNADFLRSKAEDAQEHVLGLKKALKEDLLGRKTTERIEEGFSVTMVNGELTLR